MIARNRNFVIYFTIIFFSILLAEKSFSQCSGIKKYEIGNSGCSAYFRTAPDSVETSPMEDGSVVYTTSAVCDNITYGIVLVKFKTPIGPDKQVQIETAESYCEVLKEMLQLPACLDYGLGHEHSRTPSAQGLITECGDQAQNNCKIKAWVDANFVALMYVYVPAGSEAKNNFNVQELFLGGFCFPY